MQTVTFIAHLPEKNEAGADKPGIVIKDTVQLRLSGGTQKELCSVTRFPSKENSLKIPLLHLPHHYKLGASSSTEVPDSFADQEVIPFHYEGYWAFII